MSWSQKTGIGTRVDSYLVNLCLEWLEVEVEELLQSVVFVGIQRVAQL